MGRFKRDKKENILYLIFWTLLFLAPLGGAVVHGYLDSNYHADWHLISGIWKILALLLLAFIIHNFSCAPILIYKHNPVKYVFASLSVLVLFSFLQCQTKPARTLARRGDGAAMLAPPPPPMKHAPGGDQSPKDSLLLPPRPPFLLNDMELFFSLALFLMFGLNLGVKLYYKYERDRKKMHLLKSQNLEHQLAYLKYQINPHFFMNTLNNIHALVDIDPELAKTTIVILSKMMRYILYEGDNTMIPLQRECDFIKHYVRLMSMRYSDKVKINIDVPLQAGEGQLPPLLLITFVENAFKHGITYKKQSFIDILLYVDGGKIYFSCTNSKAEKKNEEQGGVGLANVRQRLDIIYGDRYDYDVKDTDDTYQVSLTLPMDNS